MIKALLVEDELITRRGLLKHVAWLELGIEEIQSAEDAETALKICTDYKPDIIISDIKMREIDGIELCRNLKKRLSDCQIIFISSYAQKEYFKAAIELEAIQYVEKPIDLEELSNAIRKAVERYRNICEHRSLKIDYDKSVNHIRKKSLLSLLRERNNGSDNEAILRMIDLWNDKCKGFRVCIVRFADMQDNPESVAEWYKTTAGFLQVYPKLHVYTDFWDESTMVLFLSTEGMQLEDKGLLLFGMRKLAERQDKGYVHFLAIGKLCMNTSDLVCSYQSALQALLCLSYKGYGTSATDQEPYNQWQEDLGKEEELALKKAIAKMQLQEAVQLINQIFDRFITRHSVLNSVVRNICLLIYHSIREVEKSNWVKGQESNMPRKEYKYILEQAVTLQEIRDLLLRYIQNTLDGESVANQSSNALIKQVIAYIHKHYHERGLCINRMAEEVYLTPTYLSSLFKQETGLTINQYVTKVRVEYSKSLVLDPKLKLYQIAEKVGYEDAAYFARIFKNQTGMTTSEYKEKNIL